MDTGRSVDKYPARDFLPNIVIHNTLFIYDRMTGYVTRDPKRALGLYHLVGFRVVLIWWAILGRFMRRAKRCAGGVPVWAVGLLSSGSKPKGHGTYNASIFFDWRIVPF